MPPDRRSHLAHLLALPVMLLVGTTGATGCSTTGRDATAPIPVTTERPPSTTTSSAPVVTRPLVTAPPSPLLNEVAAAYEAAYADLLVAEATMDPDSAVLDNHMAGAQLETWRRVIRDLARRGVHAAARPGSPSWLRIEAMTSAAGGALELEVCRYDNTEGVGPDGNVVSAATRPFRYRETMERTTEGWTWTARDLIDSGGSSSDCAAPS